jgi:hypothetical protein
MPWNDWADEPGSARSAMIVLAFAERLLNNCVWIVYVFLRKHVHVQILVYDFQNFQLFIYLTNVPKQCSNFCVACSTHHDIHSNWNTETEHKFQILLINCSFICFLVYLMQWHTFKPVGHPPFLYLYPLWQVQNYMWWKRNYISHCIMD